MLTENTAVCAVEKSGNLVLAPSTVNLRLSPIRRLAREMADNGLLASERAAAIERVTGVKQADFRSGNWLSKELASELLNAPTL